LAAGHEERRPGMRRSGTLLLLIAWAGPAVAGEPAKTADADVLKKLVDRLGSRRHNDREAAMADLIARRSPASIELLRKAAASSDLQVRRRARAVLEHPQRRQDTERALRPQTVQLLCQDV